MNKNCMSCKYSDLSKSQKPCDECCGYDQWIDGRMTVYEFVENLRDLCNRYLEDHEQD